MSGPKTDEVEIERQRQQELAAARDRATTLATNARLALGDALNKLVNQAAGLPGAQDALDEARAIVARATSRLNSIAAFDQPVTVSEARRRLVDLEAALSTLETACQRDLAPCAARIERIAARTASARDEHAFSQLLTNANATPVRADLRGLANMLGALDQARSTGTMSAQARPTHAPASERKADDQIKRLRDVLARVCRLMEQRSTAAADRQFLCTWVDALHAAVAGRTDPAGMPDAYDRATQIELLLPPIEKRAQALRVLLARIDALEAELARRAPARAGELQRDRASLADPDVADAHAARLANTLHELDQRDYIRTCVDQIMARHGYNVMRSVTMGPAGSGDHLVFSGAHAAQGVHAFISNEGDLMLEVVGLDEHEPLADGDTVAAQTTTSPVRQDELLDAQHDFCSVYAQIAGELAAYGIHRATRHHAQPNLQFCKELHAAGRGEKATGDKNATRTENDTRSTPRRRKRSGGTAREMS